MKRLLLCFVFVLLLFVAGCSSNKETYVVKKVMIDVNGEAVLRDLDKDTLKEYPIIPQAINAIGNKIVIKENEVIFNGSETKNLKAVIDYDEEYDEDYIKYLELPTIYIKGSKICDNEIHIYISVNQTLSYLIYEKK